MRTYSVRNTPLRAATAPHAERRGALLAQRPGLPPFFDYLGSLLAFACGLAGRSEAVPLQVAFPWVSYSLARREPPED